MRNVFFLLSILSCNIFISCGNKNSDNSIPSGGFVALQNFTKEDTVRIFDDDGELWYAFTFFYDESEGFEGKDDFRPYTFHPDYFLLVFKGEKTHDGWYRVFINDSTEKYLKQDGLFEYYDWKSFILNYDCSIDVSQSNVYTDNSLDSEVIENLQADYFFPESIEGEWLKITWEDRSSDKKRYGWIRWRDKGDVLIRFNFL